MPTRALLLLAEQLIGTNTLVATSQTIDHRAVAFVGLVELTAWPNNRNPT